MSKKIYITTAIDYINAKPHVGHAVEKIQADALARWHRKMDDDVYFLSGTDENSLKNVQAAKKLDMPILDFVDEFSKYFLKLKSDLNLSYDYFIRTTEKKHTEGAQKFWNLLKNEDLYKKNYKGFYCVGCEEFKLEKDLVDGCCPEHKTKPEVVEEENYFFALSKYQDRLIEIIESGEVKIMPDFRRNEILSFIRSGLDDFSVSRSVKRAENWGVPVPGDKEQVMYVWVDALSNYITALDFVDDGKNYKKYWENGDERIHVIGKGILRFHAVYWLAMLLSANLPLPTKILSHEYLTINGQKISKSLGNVIDPEEVVTRYGTDAARYLLLTSLPFNSDGDVSWAKMDERYQSDLSNNLGNLVQRTISMINKYELNPANGVESEPSEKLAKIEIQDEVERLDYVTALRKIMDYADLQNRLIAEKQPWVLAKEGKSEELLGVLSQVYFSLHTIAGALVAFMPDTAQKIINQLETLKPEVLFPRLEENTGS